MLTAPAPLTVDHDRKPWRYMRGDEGLWGTTDVLRAVGLLDPTYYTEESRERGRAVHLATAYHDQGRLNWGSLHVDLHGYVHSWDRLVRFHSWVMQAIEVARAHPLYPFAGTLDRLVLDPAGWEWVLDLKTISRKGGAAPAAARYQTGAYDLLLPPPARRGTRRRGAVELYADGAMARLIPHTDACDPGYFLAFLTTAQRRRYHGID